MKGKTMELTIDVIATFKNHNQEFFDIDLNIYDLECDLDHFLYLIDNYFSEYFFDYDNDKTMFDYNNELVKLSTCILFDNQEHAKKCFKRYPLVKELLKTNGKLFFKNGKLQ